MGDGKIFLIFSATVAQSKANRLVSLSTPVTFRWTIPLRSVEVNANLRSYLSKSLGKYYFQAILVPHSESGVVPMSSLLGVGQMGFWEVGKGGTIG